MKKVLFILFALSCAAWAQPKGERPDYGAIKKLIGDKKSENYFPKLMDRYTERDTTMTTENYRNLYYGFVFQKAYNPYGRSDKLDDLRQYDDLEKLDKGELKKVLSLTNDVLKDDPFDLNTMNMQAYVYHLSGDDATARKISTTIGKIFLTIMGSGDGKTCDTGFHVQSISHEYVVLHIIGLESASQSLVDHCDYLAFEKGKYNIDGLFFDVSKMQESMMESLGK